MTPEQYQLCQILHYCTYLPGSFEKRFARNIQAYPQAQELTEKQATWLLNQAHRYRRQLEAVIDGYVQDLAMRRTLHMACALARWEAPE